MVCPAGIGWLAGLQCCLALSARARLQEEPPSYDSVVLVYVPADVVVLRTVCHGHLVDHVRGAGRRYGHKSERLHTARVVGCTLHLGCDFSSGNAYAVSPRLGT